jgi:hypothetical protein
MEKSNLQPILNIELFQFHTKLKLGVLGAMEKLVKDVVHTRRLNFEKEKFIFLQAAQTENDYFWVSRNFSY